MQRMFHDLSLDSLLEEAKTSGRLRKTTVLTPPSHIGVRGMINVLAPGTYVQPHRHNEVGANEWWFVLRGIIYPMSFTETGELQNLSIVSSLDAVPLVENEVGTYHSLVVRNPSVILEFSRGPYNPETYKEMAPWAPAENSQRSIEYLHYLESLVTEKFD